MAYQLLKRRAEDPGLERSQVQPQASPQYGGGIGLEGEGMGTQLDARMQARIQQVWASQNDRAEREADEIAASVSTARTPQEVKAQLGERMGADFSNVRFHTGSDALQRAEGIGARAYATGRDIYFGEGGFDPAVAAHELVHTAQQGVVDSGMPPLRGAVSRRLGRPSGAGSRARLLPSGAALKRPVPPSRISLPAAANSRRPLPRRLPPRLPLQPPPPPFLSMPMKMRSMTRWPIR